MWGIMCHKSHVQIPEHLLSMHMGEWNIFWWSVISWIFVAINELKGFPFYTALPIKSSLHGIL